MSVKVRILGDDSDLQNKLRSSASSIAKWSVGAIAAVGTISAAMVKLGLDSGDSLAKTARALDGTEKGLQALSRAASRAGVSQSSLETATLRLNQRLGEAMTKGGEAGKTLQRLGLDANDLIKMDIDERMATIADRMRGLGLNSAETAYELRNLGIRQSEIVSLMQDGGDAIRESSKKIDEYGVALSAVDAAKIEAANDAMGEIGIMTSGLSQQLAARFAPIIEAIATKVGELAKRFGGMGKIAQRAFDIVITGAGYAANALRGIQIGLKLGEAAWQGFRGGVTRIIHAVVERITEMAMAARNSFNAIIDGANSIRGVDIPRIGRLDDLIDFSISIGQTADEAIDRMRELGLEAHEMAMQELPSVALKNWADEVTAAADEAAEATINARKRITGDGGEEGAAGLTDQERAEMEARLESVRESMMEETELLKHKHAQQLEELEQFREHQLVNQEEYNELLVALEERHADKLTEIKQRAADREKEIEDAKARAIEQRRSRFYDRIIGLARSGSQKANKVVEAAALVAAGIKGKQAIMDAWQAGMSTGGPHAPLVAAGYATAAAIESGKLLADIKSAGSGGGGSSGGGSASAPTVAQAPAAPAGGTLSVSGISPSALFSGDMVSALANELLDYQRRGGTVVFA